MVPETVVLPAPVKVSAEGPVKRRWCLKRSRVPNRTRWSQPPSALGNTPFDDDVVPIGGAAWAAAGERGSLMVSMRMPVIFWRLVVALIVAVSVSGLAPEARMELSPRMA